MPQIGSLVVVAVLVIELIDVPPAYSRPGSNRRLFVTARPVYEAAPAHRGLGISVIGNLNSGGSFFGAALTIDMGNLR